MDDKLREQYIEMFKTKVPMEMTYPEDIEDNWLLTNSPSAIIRLPIGCLRPAPITLDTIVSPWLEYKHSHVADKDMPWQKISSCNCGKIVYEVFSNYGNVFKNTMRFRYRDLLGTVVELLLEEPTDTFAEIQKDNGAVTNPTVNKHNERQDA